MGQELSIAHIVPLRSERRWSDLLTVLIEPDPMSAAALLGLDGLPGVSGSGARSA